MDVIDVAPRATDSYGNEHAPGLPYARGRILASTEDDFRKLQEAWRHVAAHVESGGPDRVYNFSGLEHGLPLAPEELPVASDFLAPPLYLDRFREAAVAHLGGTTGRHDAALFNRLTGATFATHLVLARPGDVVVGISEGHSHASVVRSAGHIGARLVDTRGIDRFEEALASEPDVALVVLTRLAVTYELMALDHVRAAIEMAHAKGAPVYVDDAGGARVGPALFGQPGALALGADIVGTGLDKYGVTGPRLGVLAGEASLVSQIRARGFELGLEARPLLYPAAVRSLEGSTPERVRELHASSAAVAAALRPLIGDRVFENDVIAALLADDVLAIALERAGLKEPPIVPYEATSALAMLLVRDHGVITVQLVGLPPGTSSLMLKFIPPESLERFGGAAAYAAAIDDCLSKLAGMLARPEEIRRLLLRVVTGSGVASLTPEQIRAAIDEPDRRAEIPATALAQALLERIGELDGLLNAFITVTPELALADARRADEARAAGRPLPLDGMPIAVKDLIDVAGVRMTGASRLFERRVAEADAAVVARLREAGAVVLGKVNLHELAYGATTTNPPPFGACRNPWDRERMAGGSSGGSAAALAADLCVGALGTDTGGSIRIPSALCGTSGLRPTYGAVSNRGALHVAPTFDTIGPMARSVDDVARLYAHLAGYDPDDPFAVRYPAPEHVETDVTRLTIGLPRDFFYDSLEPEIAGLVEAAEKTLAGLGVHLQEIELGADESLCRATGVIVRSEAIAVYREHVDAHPELIGEQIRRRFQMGEELRGEEVAAAHMLMREWQGTLRKAFESVDAILTPATNTVAPSLAEPNSIETTWKLTYLTYPWSLSQTPTLTFPCGFTAAGLPVGVQLTSFALGEPVLFAIGSGYQRATDWHRRRPTIEERQ